MMKPYLVWVSLYLLFKAILWFLYSYVAYCTRVSRLKSVSSSGFSSGLAGRSSGSTRKWPKRRAFCRARRWKTWVPRKCSKTKTTKPNKSKQINSNGKANVVHSGPFQPNISKYCAIEVEEKQLKQLETSLVAVQAQYAQASQAVWSMAMSDVFELFFLTWKNIIVFWKMFLET